VALDTIPFYTSYIARKADTDINTTCWMKNGGRLQGSIGIENARMYIILKADHEKLIYDVHQWFDYGRMDPGEVYKKSPA